jgi:hypothetical protein
LQSVLFSLLIPAAPQADAERALASAESASSSSSSSDSDDSSNGSASPFGIRASASASAKPPAAPKRLLFKQKVKMASPGGSTPSRVSKADEAGPKSKSTNEAKDPKNAGNKPFAVKIDEAGICLGLLHELSVTNLWKGTFKAKEINSRLSKSALVQSDLGILIPLNGSDQTLVDKAEEVKEQLNKMVLAIPSAIELFKQLQSPSVSIKNFLRDPRAVEDFKHIFATGMDIDNEAVSAISVHMGQKLLEDLLCKSVICFCLDAVARVSGYVIDISCGFVCLQFVWILSFVSHCISHCLMLFPLPVCESMWKLWFQRFRSVLQP